LGSSKVNSLGNEINPEYNSLEEEWDSPHFMLGLSPKEENFQGELFLSSPEEDSQGFIKEKSLILMNSILDMKSKKGDSLESSKRQKP
jgi:hypothetical protein